LPSLQSEPLPNEGNKGDQRGDPRAATHARSTALGTQPPCRCSFNSFCTLEKLQAPPRKKHPFDTLMQAQQQRFVPKKRASPQDGKSALSFNLKLLNFVVCCLTARGEGVLKDQIDKMKNHSIKAQERHKRVARFTVTGWLMLKLWMLPNPLLLSTCQ
jgi:hypothetical protein